MRNRRSSLTNQLTRTAAKLVGRYAQRMIIENSIADGIDFFHMDALSSAVAMKVNCDLQLTLMASSLYRLLAGRHRPGLRAHRVAASVPRLRGCHGRGGDHRVGLLWCGIRSVLITPCSSRLALIRRRRPSPGWGGSDCDWCSDSTLPVV